MRPDGTRHTLKDLYHENTAFDFLHRRWRWVLISGALLLISVAGFVIRDGLNLGLDFTGGTSWQLTVAKGQSTSTADIRALLEQEKVSDPKIVLLGAGGIRVETVTPTPDREQAVTDALAKYGRIQSASVSVSEVGPSWGEKVSREALIALMMFFVAIAFYLSLRFEFKMAVAAIVAVVHDIAITVGVYAVTGIEVTPATVIAFLTILGFSLYDTVVVFDKIRENEPQLNTVKGLTYTEMANQSLNQVLMRSLNTTFVALLPVTSLLVVGVGLEGALVLREFGLALFIGLIIGGYSSLFVATPILAAWKEREPRYRALAERSAQRSKRGEVPVGVGAGDAGSGPVAASVPTVGGPGPVIAPRPRQQKSKKKK
ncbi:MAG: protein translocase subunit SecF [Acidimicrobiia bacterium]|nr:protein translocase subunit SecF [Acidimicrobiia bacterium]